MTSPLSLLGSRFDAFAGVARTWLGRRSQPTFVATTVALSLGFSLLFFAPRLCLLLRAPLEGTFEWDRGLHFVAQVRDPFHAAVEPALRWRLAPALLAHALHLPGYTAFAVPWAGLVAALAYATALAAQRLRDRLDAVLLVVLLGTLAAVQSVTTAHGINDGWLLLALLITSFSSRLPLRLGAALVGPWVDERYLLALPLALVCRFVFPPPTAASTEPVRGLPFPEIAGVLPYLAIRAVVALGAGDPTSENFVHQALALAPVYLPHAPLGWWMGERAAWVLVVFAVIAVVRSRGRTGLAWFAFATIGGFGAVTLLAADLTRSTNFFFVPTCAGAFAAHEIVGEHRTRWFGGLVTVNLLLPSAMMTYLWIVPIHSLPFELLRLYKNW